jgi:uncharacterized membrane protein YccC
VTQPSDHETRISRLERRVEEVAADAAAARHLAAANDRDSADLVVKLDANRRAINALGEQTRERFDEVDRRFEQVDRRFEQLDRRFEQLEAKVDAGFAALRTGHDELSAAMRHGFDQSAAGFARIAELIQTRGPRDDR